MSNLLHEEQHSIVKKTSAEEIAINNTTYVSESVGEIGKYHITIEYPKVIPNEQDEIVEQVKAMMIAEILNILKGDQR